MTELPNLSRRSQVRTSPKTTLLAASLHTRLVTVPTSVRVVSIRVVRAKETPRCGDNEGALACSQTLDADQMLLCCDTNLFSFLQLPSLLSLSGYRPNIVFHYKYTLQKVLWV